MNCVCASQKSEQKVFFFVAKRRTRGEVALGEGKSSSLASTEQQHRKLFLQLARKSFAV
jgi:hypothetical protein